MLILNYENTRFLFSLRWGESMRILVPGGTGALGSAFSSIAAEKKLDIRIASRNKPQHQIMDWSFLDLATGHGMEEAFEGIEVVLHAATSAAKNSAIVDIEGTKKIIEACKEKNVKHLIFPSIVGIESLPMSYYKSKLEAEKIIAESGVPHTIKILGK
jgi:uncharacterized protein YbjT (DUF2867 family)